MANSILPNQIGFLPAGSGVGGIYQGSALVFGKNPTGGWQSVGFGSNGQPDILQSLKINISSTGVSPAAAPIVINIRSEDVLSLYGNTHAPRTFQFNLKEVFICEVDPTTQESVEKCMVVLASQTYLPSGAA